VVVVIVVVIPQAITLQEVIQHRALRIASHTRQPSNIKDQLTLQELLVSREIAMDELNVALLQRMILRNSQVIQMEGQDML
jgi:hypothetical protein